MRRAMQPGIARVVERHSGAEYEAGQTQEHRNLARPGVEVVDGRERPEGELAGIRQTGLDQRTRTLSHTRLTRLYAGCARR